MHHGRRHSSTSRTPRSGMRAQQVELQGVQVGLRDTRVGKLAKTGVHAIDGGTALCGLLDQLRAGANTHSG